MSDASLTNIRMVKPKGPKIFLGVIALAAIGAGAWYLMRPAGPVGEPEDPRKILVVGKDADVATTLRELGFLTEHGTFEALAAEGAQQGAKGSGIAAILHLADVRGIGYVALEGPATHDLEGMTVTGDSHAVKAEHRYAVLTVGDLGMPPRVTVDAEPSELPLPPYVELLRAAFAQQRLAGTLFAESQLPMDAVELHHAIKPAVELHGAYAVLDRRVSRDLRKRSETLVDAEQGPRKGTLLAGPLEATSVLALGDGTVLSLVHAWRLESPRDVEVSLQPMAEVELWFHPPGSTELAARKRCSALRSGTMALGGTLMVTSPRADAMLVESESGLELWTLDTSAGACAFTRKGVVPRPSELDSAPWGAPDASGRVLRPSTAGGILAVDVWTTGVDRPQAVPMPGCSSLGDPVWLDQEHFAIACAFEPPPLDPGFDDYDDEPDADPVVPPDAGAPPPPAQAALYVTRIADGKTVAIPGALLGEHTGVYTLHAVPSGEGLELLAVHPWGDKLLRVRSARGPAALLTEAEAAFAVMAELDAKEAAEAALVAEALLAGKPVPMTASPEEPPPQSARPAFVPPGAMVAALQPDRVTVTPLDAGGEFYELSASPDGTRVVFTTSRDHEIRVLALADGQATTIAKNAEATYRSPRFTADGKAVAFTSNYDGNDRTEQVGQVIALGQ